MKTQPKPYRIYWHDPAQTICVLEAYSAWTWDDFRDALKEINSEIAARCEDNVPVYSVLWSRTGINPLSPSSESRTSYFQRMTEFVRADPQQEELCVMAGMNYYMQEVLNITAKMCGVFVRQGGYRFAATFDEAIRLIEVHKQQHRLRRLS